MTRELLTGIIDNELITPVYQPIVDLFTGEIYAYEVLSRFPEACGNPGKVFEAAHRLNLSWELELACRSVIFSELGRIHDSCPDTRFFVNVSPHIFSDPRFLSGTILAYLKSQGLNPEQIVIEITESTTVNDYQQFESIITHYVAQGFDIALDDFGAGHSGLITLLAMTPHFLKLDREIISNIHESSYKQNLVRSIITFGKNVETSLLGEGIESLEELQILMRLGVRFGQGYYLGRPSTTPGSVNEDAFGEIVNLNNRINRGKFSVDLSLSRLVTRPLTFTAGSITCGDLEKRFSEERNLDHVVMIKGNRPAGIITKQQLYTSIGGQFGYSVLHRKSADLIIKEHMLCINEHTDLRSVSRDAMARSPDYIYDPVVIVDNDGALVGTITMKQVINTAFDLEIKIATCANPLTQLPGNMIIGFWLEDAISSENFAVLYVDLDHFKEYNDSYGFASGDDLLRFTSRMLQDAVSGLPGNTRLGHIGGDDFLLVSDQIPSSKILDQICAEFDSRKLSYFTKNDRERGWYESRSRTGRQVKVALVTMSISVLSSENFAVPPHPGRLGQIAALLKKEVKSRNRKSGKSSHLFERRIYE